MFVGWHLYGAALADTFAEWDLHAQHLIEANVWSTRSRLWSICPMCWNLSTRRWASWFALVGRRYFRNMTTTSRRLTCPTTTCASPGKIAIERYTGAFDASWRWKISSRPDKPNKGDTVFCHGIPVSVKNSPILQVYTDISTACCKLYIGIKL